MIFKIRVLTFQFCLFNNSPITNYNNQDWSNIYIYNSTLYGLDDHIFDNSSQSQVRIYNSILNGTKLRFPNEPVRHKAVDLLGDLALLGIPIRGHVIATKSDFNIQYAAVRNEGIIKSTDGGLTWSATASFPVNSNARIEIAASRTDPNKVYAGVAGGGLVVTNDGGTTWKTIPDNTGWLSGQGWYDNIITVNPYVDTIIYVGGIDLWKFTVNFSTNTKTDTRISDAYNGSINGFGWTSGVH